MTLPTKVRLVKAMVFPMVMYGCESCTVKKAESQRIGAFELWCWRRLLRVPWTARRSNQSILKEISPGIFLEGMMLKLKLQYFGHLMHELTHWKRLWCWEGLGAGGEGDDRGWDGWIASPTRWMWTPGVVDGQESLECCDSWGCKELDTTERLDWTDSFWNITLPGLERNCSLLWWSQVNSKFILYWSWNLHSPVSGTNLFIMNTSLDQELE